MTLFIEKKWRRKPVYTHLFAVHFKSIFVCLKSKSNVQNFISFIFAQNHMLYEVRANWFLLIFLILFFSFSFKSIFNCQLALFYTDLEANISAKTKKSTYYSVTNRKKLMMDFFLIEFSFKFSGTDSFIPIETEMRRQNVANVVNNEMNVIFHK